MENLSRWFFRVQNELRQADAGDDLYLESCAAIAVYI